MNIRPAIHSDIAAVEEIDSVIESSQYLHIDRVGEGLSVNFKLEQRPLREKLIASNPLDGETRFTLSQIATSADEGVAWVAQHDQRVTALLLAQARPELGTMRVLDLRVDCEFRRQGLATVLIYQLIEKARDAELRAVSILTQTNNVPAATLLQKVGFELSGLDTRRMTNHDLVKESATLVWYYPIN